MCFQPLYIFTYRIKAYEKEMEENNRRLYSLLFKVKPVCHCQIQRKIFPIAKEIVEMDAKRVMVIANSVIPKQN